MADSILKDMQELAQRSYNERTNAPKTMQEAIMDSARQGPEAPFGKDPLASAISDASAKIKDSAPYSKADMPKSEDIENERVDIGDEHVADAQQMSAQQIVNNNQKNTQEIVERFEQNTDQLENKFDGLDQTLKGGFDAAEQRDAQQLKVGQKQLATMQSLYDEIYRENHEIDPTIQKNERHSLSVAAMHEEMQRQREEMRNKNPFEVGGLLGTILSGAGILGAGAVAGRVARPRGGTAPAGGARPPGAGTPPGSSSTQRSKLKGRLGLAATILGTVGLAHWMGSDDEPEGQVTGSNAPSDYEVQQANLMQSYYNGEISKNEYNEQVNILNAAASESGSGGSILPEAAALAGGGLLAKAGLDKFAPSVTEGINTRVNALRSQVTGVRDVVANSQPVRTVTNAVNTARSAGTAAVNTVRTAGSSAMSYARGLGWKGKLLAGVAGGFGLYEGMNALKEVRQGAKEADINDSPTQYMRYGEEMREQERRVKAGQAPMSEQEQIAFRSSITMKNGYMPDPRTGYPLKNFARDNQIANIMSDPSAIAAIRNGAPINDVLGGNSQLFLAKQGLAPSPTNTTTAANVAQTMMANNQLPKTEDQMFSTPLSMPPTANDYAASVNQEPLQAGMGNLETAAATVVTAGVVGKFIKDKMSDTTNNVDNSRTFNNQRTSNVNSQTTNVRSATEVVKNSVTKLSEASKNVLNSVKEGARSNALVQQTIQQTDKVVRNVKPIMTSAGEVSRTVATNAKTATDVVKNSLKPVVETTQKIVSPVTTAASKATTAVGNTKVGSAVGKGAKALGSRALPGLNVALAGYDIYDIATDDTLDTGTKAKEIAKVGGGTAGAIAGAASLGSAGLAVGAATGPFAPIVAPVLGIAGSLLGGIGGYLAGSGMTEVISDGISDTVDTLGVGDMIGRAVALPMSLFSEEARDSLASDFKNNIVPSIMESTPAKIAGGVMEGVSSMANAVGDFFGWTDEVQKDLPDEKKISEQAKTILEEPTVEKVTANVQKTEYPDGNVLYQVDRTDGTSDVVSGENVGVVEETVGTQVLSAARIQKDMDRERDVYNSLTMKNTISSMNNMSDAERGVASERLAEISEEKTMQRATDLINTPNGIVLPTAVRNKMIAQTSPQSKVSNLKAETKELRSSSEVIIPGQGPFAPNRGDIYEFGNIGDGVDEDIESSYMSNAGQMGMYSGQDSDMSMTGRAGASVNRMGNNIERSVASAPTTIASQRPIPETPAQRQKYESVSKVMMIEPKIQKSANTNTDIEKKIMPRTGGVAYTRGEKSSLEDVKSTPVDFGLPLLNTGYI